MHYQRSISLAFLSDALGAGAQFVRAASGWPVGGQALFGGDLSGGVVLTRAHRREAFGKLGAGSAEGPPMGRSGGFCA